MIMQKKGFVISVMIALFSLIPLSFSCAKGTELPDTAACRLNSRSATAVGYDGERRCFIARNRTSRFMSATLLPGGKPVIPGKEKAEQERRKPEKKELSSAGKKDDAGKEEVYHRVRKGETLYGIAKKHSLTLREIRKLNNIGKDRLKPGQHLIVRRPKDPAKMSVTERLILCAKKLLHVPYRFGGSGIFGIDCSAFVKKVYSLVGLDLPRRAREQFSVGEKVKRKELSAGDLVFFRTYASFPSHVGIYLGNNLFIHASSKAKKVTISRLDAPFYRKRFIGAKRMIPLALSSSWE